MLTPGQAQSLSLFNEHAERDLQVLWEFCPHNSSPSVPCPSSLGSAGSGSSSRRRSSAFTLKVSRSVSISRGLPDFHHWPIKDADPETNSAKSFFLHRVDSIFFLSDLTSSVSDGRPLFCPHLLSFGTSGSHSTIPQFFHVKGARVHVSPYRDVGGSEETEGQQKRSNALFPLFHGGKVSLQVTPSESLQAGIARNNFSKALVYYALSAVLKVEDVKKSGSQWRTLPFACQLSPSFGDVKGNRSHDDLLSWEWSPEPSAVRVQPFYLKQTARTSSFSPLPSSTTLIQSCVSFAVRLVSLSRRDHGRAGYIGSTVRGRKRAFQIFCGCRWLTSCFFAWLFCLSRIASASDIPNGGTFSPGVWGWGGQPQSLSGNPPLDSATNYQPQPSWTSGVQQQWGMLPQQYPVAYLPLAPQWGKTPSVSLEGTGERKDKSAGEAFTDRSSSQDPAPVQQENLRTESRSPSSSVRGSEFTAASQWGASPSVPQAQHWNTPMQQRTSDPSVAVAPAAVRGENAQIGPTAAPYRQNASSQNGEDEQASAVPLPRAPDVVVPTYTVQNRDNASSPATPTDDTRPAPVQAAPAVRPASDHTSSPPAANSVTAQDTRQKQPSSQHPYADSDRRQKEIYDSGRVTQTSGPPASPSWQMPTSSVSTPPEAFQAAPSSQGIEVPHQHQEAGHSDTYQDRPNTWFDDRLSAPVSPQQNMQSAPQNESPPPEKIQQQRTVYESFQTAPPEPPNTFQNPPNFPGMIPQAGGVDGRGSLPSSFAWNPQQGQNALDVPSSPVMSPYFPTVSPAVGFFPPPSYPQSPLTAGAMWHPTMMNTLPRLTSHQPSAALPFLPVPPEGLPGTVAGVSLDPGHSVYPYAHFPFNFRPTPTPLPSYSAPWMMPTFHPNGNSSPWLQVFNIQMSPPPLPSSPDNAWTSAALSPPGGEDNRHDGKLQQEAEDARTRIIQKKDRGKSIQEEKSASARGARAIEHADKRGFRDETDSSQDDSNTVEEDSTDRHWNSPGPRSSRSPAFIEVRNEAMILERELQGTSLDEVHPALRGGPERDMPVGAFYHFQGRDGRMQDSKKFSHPRGPNYPERTSNHGTKWSPGGTGGRNPPHRSFDQDDDSDELIAYRPYKSHRNRETNYDDPNTLHSRPRDPPFRESPGIKFANPTRRTRGEEREFSRPFRPSVSLPSNDILENLFGSLYTETTRRSTLGTLCAEETFRIAWLTDLEVDPGYSSRASVKMSCRDPDRGKTHHNPGTDEVSPSTPEQGQQPHGLSRSDAAHVPDKASSTSPFTNTTTAATTTENLTSSFINSHHDTPLTYQRSSSNSEERHRGEQPSASIVERITTTERVPPGTPAALTSTDSSKEIEERVGLNADENALPFGDPSQGSSSETRGLGQRDGGESTDNQTIEKNQGDDPHESNGHKDDIMNTNRSSNSRQEKEGNIRKPEDLTEEEKVDEVSPATAVLGRPGCDAPLVLLDKALDDIQTLADISSTLEGLLLTQQREEDEAPTSEEVDGTSFSPWEHDRWREWAGKNERQEPRLWPEEFHDTDSYRVPSNQDSKDLILRYLKARSHLYNPPHNPTLVEEVQNKTQVPQPLHFEKESVPLTDNLQDAFEKTTPSFIDESPGTAHYVLRPLRLSKGSLESKNEQTSHPFRGHPEISSSQPNEKGEEELRWSSVKYLWSILENIERAPHQVLPSQVSPLPVVVQLPSGFLWEQMQTIERQESLSPDIQTTRDGQRLVVVPTLQPFYRPTQDRKVDTPPPPPGVWTILHDDLLLQQHRSQTFLRVMLLLMALRRRYGHVSRTPVVVFPDEARSTARKTEEDFLNESSHTDGTVRTQENQTTGSSELLVATSQPERVHGGAALVEEGQAEKEKHRETRRLGRKTVIGSTVLKGYRDETGTEEKMEWDEDEEDLEMPYVRRREYGKGYYAEREREDAFTEGGRRREEEDEEEEKMRLFTKKEKDETDQLLCIAQTPVEAILVSGDFVGKTPSYNDEERWKALSEATKRLYQRFLFFSPSPTSTSSTLSEMSHHASPDLPHKEGKDTAFSSDAQPESNLQRSSTNDQQPGGHHSTLTEEQEENDIGRYQEIRRATSKKGQSSSLLPEKKTRSGVTGETSPSKHMASMQLIFVVGEKDIPLERGQGGGLSLPSLSWRKKLYELWKPILPGDEANRKTFLRGLYYRTELRKRPGVIFLVLNSLLYSPSSASSDRSSFPFSPPRRCRVSVASPGASSRYSSESISNTPTTTSVNNTCADDGIEGVGDIRKESSPAFSSSEESGRDTFISDDESDPAGQFAWLEGQLNLARSRGEQAIIAGHIPPGIGRAEGGEDLLLWKSSYTRKFLSIASRFPDVIVAHVFGHLHEDTFRTVSSPRPSSRSGAGLAPRSPSSGIPPSRGSRKTTWDNITRQPLHGPRYLRGSQYFADSYYQEYGRDSLDTTEAPQGHPRDSTSDASGLSSQKCLRPPPPPPPFASEDFFWKRGQEEAFSWQPPMLIGPSLSPRYGAYPAWRMLLFSPYTYTQPMPPSHLLKRNQSERGRRTGPTTMLLARPRYVLQDYFQYQIPHPRDSRICSNKERDGPGSEQTTMNGETNLNTSIPTSFLFEPTRNVSMRNLSATSKVITTANENKRSERSSDQDSPQRRHTTEPEQNSNREEVHGDDQETSLAVDPQTTGTDDVNASMTASRNTTEDLVSPRQASLTGRPSGAEAGAKLVGTPSSTANQERPSVDPPTAAARNEKKGKESRRLERQKEGEYFTAADPGYAQEEQKTEEAVSVGEGSPEALSRGFSLRYMFTALHEKACLSALGLASIAESIRRSREVFERVTIGKGQTDVDRATFYCQTRHLEVSEYEECMQRLHLEIHEDKHHVPRPSANSAESPLSMTVAQAILSRIRG